MHKTIKLWCTVEILSYKVTSVSIHDIRSGSKCYRRLRNNYVCLQVLVNKLTLEKQQKLFVQGYNLEVHDVIKYTQKLRFTPC